MSALKKLPIVGVFEFCQNSEFNLSIFAIVTLFIVQNINFFCGRRIFMLLIGGNKNQAFFW